MAPDGTGTYEDAYGGAQVANSSATVSRSKIVVAVPPAEVLGYVQLCLAIKFPGFYLQTCCPDFAEAGCPDNALVHREPTNFDDSTSIVETINWTEYRARLWVASPPKSPKPFGTFRPAKIKILAFGSVPVTATVNLTQPADAAGFAQPLRYRDVNMASQFENTIVGGLNGGKNRLFEAVTTFGGPVDIRLSDVRVDGVPLDVGPRCRTITPGNINYRGPRGWVTNDVAPNDLAGRPGEFQPINPDPTGTGTGTGTISIPRFTGCRDGARSLDPLITAFASGNSNPVRISLSQAIRQCTATVSCPAYPPNSTDMPPPRTVARALAALSPQLRAELRKKVLALAPASRSAALRTLPGLVQR